MTNEVLAIPQKGTWSAQIRKYMAIARINLQNSLAYTWEAFSQGLLIIIFMLIFAQLWKATFAAQGVSQIGGLTLTQTIWYFVWAEMVMLSKTNIAFKMQQEVRDGSLAYTLGRPYNYLLYHFFSSLGEVSLRMIFTLLFGSIIALFEAGYLNSFQFVTLPAVLLITGFALVIDYCMAAMIGLSAFIFEDTSAFRLIYHKLHLVVGGVLLPIDFLPEGIQAGVRLLPFNLVIYAPAKLFVNWDSQQFLEMLALQLIWIGILGTLLWLFFSYSTRHVSINGG